MTRTPTRILLAAVPALLVGTLHCSQKAPEEAAAVSQTPSPTPTPTPTPTPPPTPPPPVPQAPLGVYGAGWAGNSLNNYPIGSSRRERVSYRFRALQAGRLQTLRVFWVDNRGSSSGGYANGTGGTIRIDVLADDEANGHVPTGSPLGTMTVASGLSGGVHPQGNAGLFRLMAFTTPPTVAAGQLYHLVFTNVDADPVNNWVSLDGLVSWTASQPNPALSTVDFAVLSSTGGSWREITVTDGASALNTPVMDLGYEDGHHQGNGYMEVWIGQPRTISGAQMVREVFTPSQDVRVDGVGLRLRRSGTAGTITYRLETGDGTLVEEVAVNGFDALTDRPGWLWGPFKSARTLSAGQKYNLVFSSADGRFEAFPLRDGAQFGFTPATVFGDGHCEFNSGSGWLGWDGWTSSGSSAFVYGDLQFYFRVAQ